MFQIKSQRSVFNDDLYKGLLETAQELDESGRLVLQQLIKRILKERKDELQDLEVKVDEMNDDIDGQLSEKLEKEIKAGYQGKITQEATQAQNQTRASLLVGDKYLTWPFEGEFWADEIDSYRSYLTNQCPPDEEEE